MRSGARQWPSGLAVHAALAALVACGPGGAEGGRLLGEGDPLPLVEYTPGLPALVWVIDAQACLGCDLNDPARIVRSVRKGGGEDFAVQVIALSDRGEEDRSLVEGFLSSHRILGQVAIHSYREHARAFGSGPVPGFYLVDDRGIIRAVVAAAGAEEWRSSVESRDVAGFLKLLAEEGKGEGIEGKGEGINVGSDR